MDFTDGVTVCTNCSAKLADGAKFCSQCGSKIQDSTESPQQKEEVVHDHSNDKKRMSPVQALFSHFVDEEELFWWLPNCPSCGSEDITIDRTNDILECERCASQIKGKGWGWQMIRGTPELVGEHHNGFTWKRIAERTEDSEEIPEIVEVSEGRNQIDQSVVDQPKTITIGLVSGYLIGGLTTIVGISQFLDGLLSGVIIFFAGLWALPPVRKVIEEVLNVKFSRWVVVVVFILLYGLGAWLYSAILAA